MKLLLRDSIASLRERRELEHVLVPLLIANGLRIVREPSTGQAEHGLDIGAVGTFPARETLILMQVKQGDITRAGWNSGPNAVRPSLDDLIDHVDTFQSLTGKVRSLPAVIVLAHNGHIQPDVRPAYDGYVRGVRRRCGIQVIHWDFDQLTDLFAGRLFLEELFPQQSVSLLRRLLAFLEVPGYDLRHLRRLLDALLPGSTTTPPARDVSRALLQAATILLMVEVMARHDANDLGIAVRAYELGFLRIFRWLRGRGLPLEKNVQLLVARVLDSYTRVALEFLGRIAPLVEHNDGLARVGRAEVIEYPLRCLHVGGLAAQLFLLLLPHQRHPPAAEALRFLVQFLLHFRRTATGATRPIFDHHLTEVALLAAALHTMGRTEEAQTYVRSVIEALVFEKMRGLPLPEGTGKLDAVGQLLLGSGKPADYVDASSCLLTALAELCAIFDLPDAYRAIREHWSSGVNLQQWYPTDAYVDVASQRPPARGDFGSSEVGIMLPEDMAAFHREITGRTHLDAPIRTSQMTIPFFEAAAYITSRSLNLRLPPFYWRRLGGTAMYPDTKPPAGPAPNRDAQTAKGGPAAKTRGEVGGAATPSSPTSPRPKRLRKREPRSDRRRKPS